MKLFYLFIVVLISTLFVEARTIYVDELGSSGFSSIKTAIDSAVDGDRIVVTPKLSGEGYDNGVYVGFVKNNLEILSSQADKRVIWSAGSIDVGGFHNKIQNIETSASISLNGGNNSLVNSKLKGPINSSSNLFSSPEFDSTSNRYFRNYLYFDTLENVRLYLYSALMTGCNLTFDNSFQYYANALQLADGSEAFGNTFNISGGTMISRGVFGFFLNTAVDKCMFYNNFIRTNNYNNALFEFLFQTNGNGLTVMEMNNNTIVQDNNSSSIMFQSFESVVTYPSILSIQNNVFKTNSALFQRFYGNVMKFNLSYNLFSSSAVDSFVSSDTTNVLNANLSINSDGTLPPGSPGINFGNPSILFADLDHTRNDAGCYGGSFSMSNFSSSASPVRIGFVRAPKQVVNSQPVNFSADGVVK